MKTVIALSLILVVAAQAVDWRQKPSYRNAPRASHANSKNIIRGHVAPPGRFLFQVEIYTDGGTYSRCGGSLIKEDKVLTAAHCCDGARSFDVLLGANNPDIFEPRRETVTATRFTKHEKYRSSILDYDVCIIHLDGVVSGEGIATIRLPSRSQAKKLEIFKGSTATVSGWGSTSNASNTRSTKLMYADVTIMDSKKCKKTYKKNVINERKICTYNADGSGFCRGDSGGPLTITESDGVKTQVGIVSFFSESGCGTNVPDVYTRITAYLNWIKAEAEVTIRP